MEDSRFNNLEHDQQRLETEQNLQGRKLAVIENIADEIKHHMNKIEQQNESHYRAYIEMQGNIRAILDIKQEFKDSFGRLEERQRKTESFIDNLKGKLTVWMAAGSIIGTVVGGLLTTFISN